MINGYNKHRVLRKHINKETKLSSGVGRYYVESRIFFLNVEAIVTFEFSLQKQKSISLAYAGERRIKKRDLNMQR